MNEYAVQLLVMERIAEARAFAAKRARFRSPGPRRQSVRVRLGLALIRAGQWMLGEPLAGAGSPRGAS
jgi:hypothetical protein